MRLVLNDKEKQHLDLLGQLCNTAKDWSEWHGMAKVEIEFEKISFDTIAGNPIVGEGSDKISIRHHLYDCHILWCMNSDMVDTTYYPHLKVHSRPLHWAENYSKKILQFETNYHKDGECKEVRDDDIVEWTENLLKQKAKEFDNAYTFIASHEDQFLKWAEMQRQANIFYNKIQRNLVAGLRANGDFQ